MKYREGVWDDFDAALELSVWRKKKTIDNMKRAFVSQINCGECPPEDLLLAVAQEFEKKLKPFQFGENDFRYVNLRRALAERPDGVTKQQIFKFFAKKWGQEYMSVERTFYRWESGELSVNKLKTGHYQQRKVMQAIMESERCCENCHYWKQQKCWLDPYDVHPTLPDHLCEEWVHLIE